jgi:hypothetical protein
MHVHTTVETDIHTNWPLNGIDEVVDIGFALLYFFLASDAESNTVLHHCTTISLMKYELAKQLKDAGFRTLMGFPISNSDDGLYYPTLSLLIEACGDDVHFGKGRSGKYFYAYKGEIGGNEIYFGSTPEEAVAKLWLVLYPVA